MRITAAKISTAVLVVVLIYFLLLFSVKRSIGPPIATAPSPDQELSAPIDDVLSSLDESPKDQSLETMIHSNSSTSVEDSSSWST